MATKMRHRPLKTGAISKLNLGKVVPDNLATVKEEVVDQANVLRALLEGEVTEALAIADGELKPVLEEVRRRLVQVIKRLGQIGDKIVQIEGLARFNGK